MSLVLAAASPSPYWYLTRGTGIVALLLLTSGVVLGVLTSKRWSAPRWPRFVVAGLHRNVTLLGLAFVVVHVLTTILDGYAPIGLRDAVIPFVSRYRPLWVGFGAVAFDLLLAVIVTSLLRARLGYRAWRAVHWLAYASWPVALVHALGTGSDARSSWFELVAVGSVAAVLLAVLWRVVDARSGAGPVRLAGGLAALAVPAIIGVWSLTGPLKAGWARRAGTPSTLLASRTMAGTVSSGTQADAASLPTPPFDAQLSGSVSESSVGSDGLVTVGLNAVASGGVDGLLHMTLRGVPLASGGIQMTGSSVSFGPRQSPNAYSGRVVSLQGSQLVAAVHDPSGRAIDLTLVLQLNASSGTLSGTLRAA
ncbi:MAG TPA: ferric reductase-like transmembrane domain-containing protein [Gaiellaceae bacterium]